jgi:hypothetical protein
MTNTVTNDASQRIVPGHLRVERQSARLNRAPGATGGQRIATLGFAACLNPYRLLTRQLKGQVEQRLRRAEFQFQFNLRDGQDGITGPDLTAVNGNLDRGRTVQAACRPLDVGFKHRHQVA